MNMFLTLQEKVQSSTDDVIKYVFATKDNLIIEGSYIDNGTGKNIICVPSQTMCAMGCVFCHASDFIGKVKVRNLVFQEIHECINTIANDRETGYDHDRMTLVSYMGCGEPMLNVESVIDSMQTFLQIRGERPTRFAVATCMPKGGFGSIFDFTAQVKRYKLPVKLHVSLHFHDDETREQYMPNSMNIHRTILAAEMYKEATGNKVEVHYALMEDVNDYHEDFHLLAKLLDGRGFNVKFLYYSEKETLDVKSGGDVYENAVEMLLNKGIEAEYYVPPGLDIGASCGQFLMERYEQMERERV